MASLEVTFLGAEQSYQLKWWLGASGFCECCCHCRSYIVNLMFWYCYFVCLFFCFYRVANSYTVSNLSFRYLVLMLLSSYICFFFRCKKHSQYCNHVKNVFYQVYNMLMYVPPTYRRVLKLLFLIINKNLGKALASRNKN